MFRCETDSLNNGPIPPLPGERNVPVSPAPTAIAPGPSTPLGSHIPGKQISRLAFAQDDGIFYARTFKERDKIIYRLRDSSRQIHILRFWHAARGAPEL